MPKGVPKVKRKKSSYKRIATEERLRQVRYIMLHEGTDSATRISQRLKSRFNAVVSPQSAHRYVQLIREEGDLFFDSMARTVYTSTVRDEFQQINEAIVFTRSKMTKEVSGHGAAALDHALIALFERRQIIMEDMVMYPRLMEMHARIAERTEVRV